MTTKIQDSGPDSVNAFHWTLQSGWVYRVKIVAEKCRSFEDDRGEHVAIGYHGNDVPPCGAEYLYGDDEELLVISCEDDPAAIDCLEGVTLERVDLGEGERSHDGTWQFYVLEVKSDGETVIAGRC
jgi:hypothetical protein